MFEHLQRALNDLSRQQKLEFKISTDAKGYIDRECPNKACLFHFKVKPRTGSIDRATKLTCPMCGHRAPSDQWYTTKQIKEAEKLARRKIDGLVDRAMRQDANSFNRRQPSGGFLKISMQVKGSSNFSFFDMPIRASEAMELEIECDQCQTKFSVIGSAFFCPSCGHSSAIRVFEDALRKIAAKKDHIPEIRSAVSAASGRDQAEMVARSVIEGCLTDGVVAFQRFCEVLYQRLPATKKPPQNVFQRLDDGSQLWRDAVGAGYEEWVDSDQLNTVKLLFQRRHLLAHSDGFVDAKYIEKTNDQSYEAGQRIIVKAGDVDRLVGVLSVLAGKIRVAVSQHPSSGEDEGATKSDPIGSDEPGKQQADSA